MCTPQTVSERQNVLADDADGQPSQEAVCIPWQLRVLLVITTVGQYVGATAISLYTVMDLDFGPEKLSKYSLIMGSTYLISPLIGFMADTFVFRREKRRPLVILGAMGSAGTFFLFIAVPYTTENFLLFVCLSLLQTASNTCVSTSINGILVELVNKHVAETDPIGVQDVKSTVVVGEAQCGSSDDNMMHGTVQLAEENNSGSSVCHESMIYTNTGSPSIYEGTETHGTVCNNNIVKSESKEVNSEEIRTARMGKIQSEAMLFRTIGSLTASIMYTVMTIQLTSFTMLGVSSILFMCTVPAAFLLGRHPKYIAVSENDKKRKVKLCLRVESVFCHLVEGCNVHRLGDGTFGVIILLFFVFIYTSMPDSSTYYFTYIANEFSFSRWFLSLNSTIGTLGSVASSYIYMFYMNNGMEGFYFCKCFRRGGKSSEKVEEWMPDAPMIANDVQNGETVKEERVRVPVKTSAFKVFTFGSICAALGYSTNLILANGFVTETLKIPAAVYIPFDNFMTSLWSQFAFLPILSVAAERCPHGYEAFVYELFSVVSFSGGTVSGIIAIKIGNTLNIHKTDYSNLWKLLLICAVCKLLPILILAIIPVRKKKLNQ